jgi:hypothetical protein
MSRDVTTTRSSAYIDTSAFFESRLDERAGEKQQKIAMPDVITNSRIAI